LILVLGHQWCGAVIAAVEAFQNDRWPPGHIEDVIEALRPAYKVAIQQPGGDLVDKIVRAQTMLTVASLKRDKVFVQLLRTNRLAIVGGRYALETGKVDIIA
jgi:carbonic anhydrase